MNNKWNGLLLKRNLLLWTWCLIFPFQVFSQQASQPDFEFLDDAVSYVLEGRDHPYLIKANNLQLWRAVEDLYFLSPRQLVWLKQKNSQELVANMLQVLDSAEDSGLQSDDYNLPILKAKWSYLSSNPNISLYESALFDTALSISTLRYLADLRSGRIKPRSVGFGFSQQRNYDELVSLILNAIQHNEIVQLTERDEPDFEAYRQLKQALKHYRQMAREHLVPALLFEKSLKEGDSHPQVKALKRQLSIQGELNEGDLHAIDENSSLDSIYQGAVVDAVKHFQRRHGLNDDGIVGKKTLTALNIPFWKRIQQIELAMERLRWLSGLNRDEPLIMVNIPAFQLWAFDSGELKTPGVLNMKVIVGIAGENETPVFKANLAYLEFRPYWNVPKSIAVEEILPKLQENPDYLDRQNMELVKIFSDYATPLEFTADSIGLMKRGVIKVRQRPGSRNSLGLVKFIFPNKYAVYLHDTPAQSLFRSARRDFSHGCVRVAKPEALAEFVLHSGKGGWRPEKVKRAMLKGNNRRVGINGSIAVLIFYSTAQVINNKVYFFDDIYGYDTLLQQALYKQSPVANVNPYKWAVSSVELSGAQ